MEIDVPISVAYNCYLDREAIPRWMPFISSVKVLANSRTCFEVYLCCLVAKFEHLYCFVSACVFIVCCYLLSSIRIPHLHLMTKLGTSYC